MPNGPASESPVPSPRPALLALAYGVLAAVWIAGTDLAASLLSQDTTQLTLLSTIKGWLFVAATASLLYLLLKRHAAHLARHEAQLEAEKQQYRRLFQDNPSPMWVYDPASLAFLAVNEAAVQHYGYPRSSWSAMTLADIHLAQDQPRLGAQLAQAEGQACSGIWRHRRHDGTLIQVKMACQATEFNGKPARVTQALDITAEASTAERLQRISALYACLSEVNQAIVRGAKREHLLNDICRAFVDQAGTLGSLVYFWHGEAAFSGAGAAVLASLRQQCGNESGPVIERLRQGQPVIFNNITEQPPQPGWPELFQAHDVLSLAAYPLRQGGQVVGALAVFADKQEWFDAQMCGLLAELALDITFALDNLQREEARQIAEAALRLSRSKLERAEAIAHVGHWEIGPDALLACSDEIFRIFGLPPQEQAIPWATLAEQLHPDERQAVITKTEADLARYNTFDVECRILRPDGSLRFLRIYGRRTGAPNQTTNVFGAVLDITDQRQALDALRKSEESLALAVEAAGMGLWDSHLASSSLHLSPEFARMLGYEPEELAILGHEAMSDLIHPDDLPRIIEQVRRHFQGETSYFECETRLRHKEGRWIWALGRGRVTEWDSKGQPLRLSGTQLDISERKQSDDLLRLLYRAVEQSPASIAITDTNGAIEYTNARFSEVTGYTRLEAMGQNPRIVKSGLTPIPVYENLWHTIRAGGTWRGRLQNRKKNGDYYWESAVIQGICNEQGEVVNFLAIKEDITDRIAAEREISELNTTLEKRVRERTDALLQANKDLESFSYSVSHDLRAPLRAITGFSQILLDSERDNLSEDGKGMLERVAANGQRMATLIDDILEYSRAGRKEPRLAELDMARLAQDVINELSAINPKARIHIQPMPTAQGDATMLRQILSNLIGNALKFTSACDNALIEIGVEQENDRTVYFVRDNGAGFDMNYANHLFGMFQRLHSTAQFPGTGVGLAIVKRLVERHGGRIWAQAQPNQGATFRFTLGE